MNRTLDDAASRLTGWLFGKALPLWSKNGADHSSGGFHEATVSHMHLLDMWGSK